MTVCNVNCELYEYSHLKRCQYNPVTCALTINTAVNSLVVCITDFSRRIRL